MPEEEAPRTRAARAAAELALVRIVHHYGERPAFVLLGGLVPELLCSGSTYLHAGTTDVDVQVDLEIARGSVQTARLEQALRNAEFEPSRDGIWRWRMAGEGFRAEVEFELLADQEGVPAQAVLRFDDCQHLGAINLRGTGVAARDIELRVIRAVDGGVLRDAEIQVTGLAGYLLAKVAAARQRRKEKDLYDLAFVLLHNDAGGAHAAADRVLQVFGPSLGAHRTGILELQANFTAVADQGPQAYARQFQIDHPGEDAAQAAADAVLAVTRFSARLLDGS